MRGLRSCFLIAVLLVAACVAKVLEPKPAKELKNEQTEEEACAAVSVCDVVAKRLNVGNPDMKKIQMGLGFPHEWPKTLDLGKILGKSGGKTVNDIFFQEGVCECTPWTCMTCNQALLDGINELEETMLNEILKGMNDKVEDGASIEEKRAQLAAHVKVDDLKVLNEDGVVECHLPDFKILKDKKEDEYTFVPTCPTGYEQTDDVCEKKCDCAPPPVLGSGASSWYKFSGCNHGGGHVCKIHMVCNTDKYKRSRLNNGKLECGNVKVTTTETKTTGSIKPAICFPWAGELEVYDNMDPKPEFKAPGSTDNPIGFAHDDLEKKKGVCIYPYERDVMSDPGFMTCGPDTAINKFLLAKMQSVDSLKEPNNLRFVKNAMVDLKSELDVNNKMKRACIRKHVNVLLTTEVTPATSKVTGLANKALGKLYQHTTCSGTCAGIFNRFAQAAFNEISMCGKDNVYCGKYDLDAKNGIENGKPTKVKGGKAGSFAICQASKTKQQCTDDVFKKKEFMCDGQAPPPFTHGEETCKIAKGGRGTKGRWQDMKMSAYNRMSSTGSPVSGLFNKFGACTKTPIKNDETGKGWLHKYADLSPAGGTTFGTAPREDFPHISFGWENLKTEEQRKIGTQYDNKNLFKTICNGIFDSGINAEVSKPLKQELCTFANDNGIYIDEGQALKRGVNEKGINCRDGFCMGASPTKRPYLDLATLRGCMNQCTTKLFCKECKECQ